MSFIETASNNFMLVQVTVRKWKGVHQLKKGSAKAAEDANANPESFRGYMDMLGSHQQSLKDVISTFDAVRTYLRDNSLPFSDAGEGQQRRGDRLIAVASVPEVLSKLGELKSEAYAALDAFLPEYDRLREFAVQHDLGDWRNEVTYPSADEVRSMFAASVTPPKPIPTCDMSALNLPAGLAADIAARHEAALSTQLEGAKDYAIAEARDHMGNVEKQLTKGERLHQSLIDNAKRHAALLRGMVQGYDNDPRVLAMADLIDEQIGSIGNIEKVKNSATLRASAIRAAQTAHTTLGQMSQAPSTAKSVAPAASNVVVGDSLLADLID
jgi:hypothetical protein